MIFYNRLKFILRLLIMSVDDLQNAYLNPEQKLNLEALIEWYLCISSGLSIVAL